MGQLVLYNVKFLKPPAEAFVFVTVSYRNESDANYIVHGLFPASRNGTFVAPVIIPVESDAWYFVKAEVGCMPCFAEKKIYSSNAVTTVPCCAPTIVNAYVQAIGEDGTITWQGIDPVCLKDTANYNTGIKRYINRQRLVSGAPDGYKEPNTPGVNFIPDQQDLAYCPIPVISWGGLDPVCVKDGTNHNIGIKHYQNRARLVNGAPDGFIEANVSGVNYVEDEQDLINCPVSQYTWRGASPYCMKDSAGNNTGFVAYNTRERMVAGIPDGYIEGNSQDANYVAPVYNPAQCPLPAVTWQGSGPICVKDINGFNTGVARYTIRLRIVNGVADGYSEPNTPGPNFVADYNDLTTCPIPVITWQGINPFCVKDSFNNNTGYRGYAQRARYVNGVADGFIEANNQDANYIAPVQDLVSCPVPVTTTVPPTTVPATTTVPAVTWRGIEPYCEKHPTCQPGWILSPDGSTCTLEETQAPTISATDYCLARSQNSNYGPYFTRIYNEFFTNGSIMVFSPPSSDVFAQMLADPQWRNGGSSLTSGPCNRCATWIDSNCDGIPNALVNGVKTTITGQYYNAGAQRTVYVGVFGDNQFQLKVNENEIAFSTGANDMPFRVFHIFPVTLVSGMNYFNVIGTGDGSVGDAIGMIVYDDPPAAIRDATSDATLHILFNSASLIGSTIQVATCPAGWILDASIPNAYVCKRITREAPAITNTGQQVYATRERLVGGVPDGYTEPNAVGPNYVPGITNISACPI